MQYLQLECLALNFLVFPQINTCVQLAGRGVTCLFLKIKKRCPYFWEKMAWLFSSTNYISQLNHVVRVSWRKISTILSCGSFLSCAEDEFQKTFPALKISRLDQGISLNKWRKTNFLIYVCLTRVLFYLKPSGLNLVAESVPKFKRMSTKL